MTPMLIEFSAVTKEFKNHRALDSLSLQLLEGSTVGLLGPNGAGKTTCLKMMLGLLRPTSGSVCSGRSLALPLDDRSPGHPLRLIHV